MHQSPFSSPVFVLSHPPPPHPPPPPRPPPPPPHLWKYALEDTLGYLSVGRADHTQLFLRFHRRPVISPHPCVGLQTWQLPSSFSFQEVSSFFFFAGLALLLFTENLIIVDHSFEVLLLNRHLMVSLKVRDLCCPLLSFPMCLGFLVFLCGVFFFLCGFFFFFFFWCPCFFASAFPSRQYIIKLTHNPPPHHNHTLELPPPSTAVTSPRRESNALPSLPRPSPVARNPYLTSSATYSSPRCSRAFLFLLFPFFEFFGHDFFQMRQCSCAIVFFFFFSLAADLPGRGI